MLHRRLQTAFAFLLVGSSFLAIAPTSLVAGGAMGLLSELLRFFCLCSCCDDDPPDTRSRSSLHPYHSDVARPLINGYGDDNKRTTTITPPRPLASTSFTHLSSRDPQPYSFRTPSPDRLLRGKAPPSTTTAAPASASASPSVVPSPALKGQVVQRTERARGHEHLSSRYPQPCSFRSPSPDRLLRSKAPPPSAAAAASPSVVPSPAKGRLVLQTETGRGQEHSPNLSPDIDRRPPISPSSTGPSNGLLGSEAPSAAALPSVVPSVPVIPKSTFFQKERGRGTERDGDGASLSSSDSSDLVDDTSFNLLLGKGGTPVYKIPRHLEEQIEKGEVPPILKAPLCSSTWSKYFACLLYAEDLYLEKWSTYLLKDVTIQLSKREDKIKNSKAVKMFGNKENYVATGQFDKRKSEKMRKNMKTRKNFEKGDYVAFNLDAIKERRPYLLSRDFVFLRLVSGKSKSPKKFEGRLVRVVGSTTVLAEFNPDFHSQHMPENKYEVSFSFNRVCLKRAHHAVANALGPVLFNFLFPASNIRISRHPPLSFPVAKLDYDQRCALYQIMNLKSPQPYLIRGPLSTKLSFDMEERERSLSKTGFLIREAVLKLYREFNDCRILVCMPKNITCDTFVSSLSVVIPDQDMFRVNAAFRDLDDISTEVIACSSYDENNECFTCPSLSTLKGFRLILSTYMSSFRLSYEGIGANHFTHIFLVDASSVAEPEAVVPLASLANENTTVIVSGDVSNSPWYVRSDLARRCGLTLSYFCRLLKREPYLGGDCSFVCDIVED